MTEALTIQLPQETETPLNSTQRERFGYRFAYARSLDSKMHNDKGQDYLTLREDETRLAFALCDGVSQSFYGDLAAQILGDTLLEWLWKQYNNSEMIAEDLMPVLQSLARQAQEKVDRYALPVHIPSMVREVLEKKRALGSESTFVAGMLDLKKNKFACVWMGDSRLRFWSARKELTSKLGDTFHTRERWSSRNGLIGELHGHAGALKPVRRIAVYSDGLAIFEDRISRFVPDNTMSQIIAETESLPTSDDVSFLEIWLNSKQ
jgi:hypothetical protein